MALRNTQHQYGIISRLLHWVVMLCVISMLLCGVIMINMPKESRGIIFNLHKVTGVFVLSVGILFLLWSLINRKPSYPANVRWYERRLAYCAQAGLYLLLLAMPLSGWLMSTAANKSPRLAGFAISCPFVPHDMHFAKQMSAIHEVLAWTLLGFLSVHMLAALRHHFFCKNNILKRMLIGKS